MNNQDIKISIIVPAYNCEETIKKCIDSILKQSLKEIEVIIVNDGSTDNTESVINEFATLDNRIVIIKIKNSGPGKARNIGLDKARGEYIGFVDSDDYIDVEMYEKLYICGEENECDVVGCGYYIENNIENQVVQCSSVLCDCKLNKCLEGKAIREQILGSFTKRKVGGFANLWNKIYRKSFLDDNNLRIDESREFGEDWIFNINVFEKAENAFFLEEVYYHYVVSTQNSLMKKKRDGQIDLIISGREFLDECLQRNDVMFDKVEYGLKFMEALFGALFTEYHVTKSDISKICNNKTVQNNSLYWKEYPLVFKMFSFLIYHKMNLLLIAYFLMCKVFFKYGY